MRKQILLSFKFIADLVHSGFIPVSNAFDIIHGLIEMNEFHIDYLNFGKLVLIFCGLAHLIYKEENQDILRLFKRMLNEASSSII